MRVLRIAGALLAVALGTGSPSWAQPPLFTTAFPAEEFAARRARVFEAIGDGLAVLQGAAEPPAYVRFRQSNQFFYLTGVEVPRALLLLDGRTKQAALFLQPRNERLERSEGPVLVPGDDAARLTGIAQVRARDEFGAALAAAVAGGARTIYAPFREESLGASTPQAAALHARASTGDPWDGRPSRAMQFIERIKASASAADVKDLDPILDGLRLIKSPREIAAVREATRLAAAGIAEGIRNAHPGLHERDLEAIANYVFTQGGAQGIAYFALVAAGTNAYYPHYHDGSAELKSGDLVLFDYAPDFHYYTSDVTRMFPASGRFSPGQRELYTVYQELYMALMTAIRPNVAPRDIVRSAVTAMDVIVARTTFSSPKVRRAAEAFVDRYRQNRANTLGHTVGMEVHDVNPPYEVLKPGMIFTIEPALTVDEDRVYVRLEDVILVTETGYENLSASLPADADAIEKLMAETGRFEERTATAGTR